ncbi:TPA: hypothetical protein ACT191_000136 [Raoultella ornithinolytica]
MKATINCALLESEFQNHYFEMDKINNSMEIMCFYTCKGMYLGKVKLGKNGWKFHKPEPRELKKRANCSGLWLWGEDAIFQAGLYAPSIQFT